MRVGIIGAGDAFEKVTVSGRRAADARHGNRIEDSPTSRLCHCRQTGVVPGPDALYHAARLPAFRPVHQAVAFAAPDEEGRRVAADIQAPRSGVTGQQRQEARRSLAIRQ